MAKLFVTDHADPSVGLFTSSYSIESPFDQSDEKEDIEWFRKAQIDIYKEYAAGKITAEYEFERETKTDSIRFRLPSNEKAIVLKLADDAGLTLSDFMRKIILSASEK